MYTDFKFARICNASEYPDLLNFHRDYIDWSLINALCFMITMLQEQLESMVNFFNYMYKGIRCFMVCNALYAWLESYNMWSSKCPKALVIFIVHFLSSWSVPVFLECVELWLIQQPSHLSLQKISKCMQHQPLHQSLQTVININHCTFPYKLYPNTDIKNSLIPNMYTCPLAHPTFVLAISCVEAGDRAYN